jgi:hypothetical protein
MTSGAAAAAPALQYNQRMPRLGASPAQTKENP